ncbi:MAG: hypothetical protein JEZ02_13025 [Desulfatibacillum sp.]|nr:hypothetical protein [Desulfatibacillum sp.]
MIEIPVDSQVNWVFRLEDIEEGDPTAFGVSLDVFHALARMPGFDSVRMEKEILSTVFLAEKAGGEHELLNVTAVRERVLVLGKLARKLGCMAHL